MGLGAGTSWVRKEWALHTGHEAVGKWRERAPQFPLWTPAELGQLDREGEEWTTSAFRGSPVCSRKFSMIHKA